MKRGLNIKHKIRLEMTIGDKSILCINTNSIRSLDLEKQKKT